MQRSKKLLENTQHFQGLVSIKKQTLHDHVVNQIRDMIIEGYLKSGERIDEISLTKQLGVSRTPFREALRTLAAEGLTEIRSARGSIVRKLSPKEVKDMLVLLGHIEMLAGELVCQKASDKQIDHLLSIHENMLLYWKKRQRMEYYKLNQDFHTHLSLYSANEAIRETQANLQARLKRIRFLGSQTHEHWEAAVHDHEEMIIALKKKDGMYLGQMMKTHLLASWHRVKNHITD